LESLPGFQVYVETHKIQEGELEILGCWIIDVRDESVRVDGLDDGIEPLEKSLYLNPSIPSNNRCGNFVPNSISQNSGMSGAVGDSFPYPGFNGLNPLFFIQKQNVLLPRQSNHDRQPVLLSQIQKPGWRNRIGPDGVKPVKSHLSQILLSNVRRRELIPARIGAKRAICYAVYPDFLISLIKKLSFDLRPINGGKIRFTILNRFGIK
jgi:hypothetical protein